MSVPVTDPAPERVRVAVAVGLPTADRVRVFVAVPLPVAEIARVRVVVVVGLRDVPGRVLVAVSVGVVVAVAEDATARV